MSNNLFSLFLQRHIGTFIVSDKNRGTTTIIRGNGALKKIEELTHCSETTVQLLVQVLLSTLIDVSFWLLF